MYFNLKKFQNEVFLTFMGHFFVLFLLFLLLFYIGAYVTRILQFSVVLKNARVGSLGNLKGGSSYKDDEDRAFLAQK